MHNYKNNNAILDVVGDIYEAAYHPAHWERALEKICHLINARSASLLIQSHEKKRTFLMYGHAMPKMVQFAYNHGLASLDPGWKIMAAEPVGKPRLFTKSDNQNASPVYQKIIMKPARMYHLLGMNIFNDSSWHVGIGVHRDKQRGLFAQPEQDVLAELLPHLQRAILMQREFTQLRLQKRALTEGLSRLALGMILLDGLGFPVFVNPVAESILDTHPAIEVTQRGISASEPEQNTALHEAIMGFVNNQSTEVSSVSIVLTHPARKLPLTIMLAPCRDAGLGMETLYHDARIMMYLSDAAQAAPLTIESLNHNYGLSEAEALVAIGIINGLTLEQLAEANHVSVNTVKTQLKSVFRKTGCNRQVDLVRILLNKPLMQSA